MLTTLKLLSMGFDVYCESWGRKGYVKFNMFNDEFSHNVSFH
jgi:hypothetical protein